MTTIDGRTHFDSNGTAQYFTNEERARANRMRAILVEKYPDVMATENIGQHPNDALFHAETTVLLTAANENRGTLAGRTIEVFGGRPSRLGLFARRTMPIAIGRTDGSGLHVVGMALSFVSAGSVQLTYNQYERQSGSRKT